MLVQAGVEAFEAAGDREKGSLSLSSGDRETQTRSQTGRRLVPVSDFQNLPADEVIVIGQGILTKLKKPFRISSGKITYF
jgi:type IV secretory pathway TraG/TraD family ATPase VirD4